VRRLDQDPGAVAGVGFTAASTAVLEVEQDLDPLLNDVARLATFDVDDKPHPARVVLVLRVVKTLRGGFPPNRLPISTICHDRKTSKLLNEKHRNEPL
jgi:hypothetical protein